MGDPIEGWRRTVDAWKWGLPTALYPKAVRSRERGIVTDHEFICKLVSGLIPERAPEQMDLLPREALDLLRGFIASAPRSDGEWDKFRLLTIGPGSSEAQALAKIEFRRNTASMREFFGLIH